MFINLCKVQVSQAVKPGFRLFEKLSQSRRLFAASLAFVCCVGFVFGVLNVRNNTGFRFLTSLEADMTRMDQDDLMKYAYSLQKRAAQDPKAMREFNAEQVSLMLAQPDLERKDFPSVAWQYRSSSCVIDIFYAAESNEDLYQAKIQHIEMRPRKLITQVGEENSDHWGCLQSVYSERQNIIEAGFRQIYAANTQSDQSGS